VIFRGVNWTQQLIEARESNSIRGSEAIKE